VLVWRKELRPDSGGAGKQRGGLGQFMEVGAREGHEFDFQAMFDRVHHPTRGRRGGHAGACTEIAQDDGRPMQGKGKQFVPHGRKVMLAFPGGAGYGPVSERAIEHIRRDLARGYITERTARETYGLPEQQIAEVLDRASRGDDV
jgi:N-methylhydantoinase B